MERPQKQTKAGKKAGAEKNERKRLALIRLRGKVHLRGEIDDTLRHLNLKNINNCVVVENKKEYNGMIMKAKDYITWGEINEETLKSLFEKRGRTKENKKITDDLFRKNAKYKTLNSFTDAFMKLETELSEVPEIKPVFKLSPPVGGHARGGIKNPVSLGGALGYRGKEINKLIARMI